MEMCSHHSPAAMLSHPSVDKDPQYSQPSTPGACCRKTLPDSPPVCMVHGCDKLLGKAYDKKCRTCVSHRQATVVEFDGAPHRFCQKCSRFHAQSEFDGTKRNCRQRLNEHNYRQRRLRLLRKAAQQTPTAPFSCTHMAVPTTVYSGSVVYLQPSSPPASIVPQCPVVDFVDNLSTELDVDFTDLDPLIDDVYIEALFNTTTCEPTMKSLPSDSESVAKVQSLAPTRVSAPVPVPAVAPQRAYFQAQTSGDTFLSGVSSTPSSLPIELDEFLWLEQSLAQSTASYTFPDLPPIVSYPILN